MNEGDESLIEACKHCDKDYKIQSAIKGKCIIGSLTMVMKRNKRRLEEKHSYANIYVQIKDINMKWNTAIKNVHVEISYEEHIESEEGKMKPTKI